MIRVFLGILKGGLVGGVVGVVASRAGVGGGTVSYLVYATVGFLVGIACGKPPWRHETLWTPALKGLFGGLVAAGLFWVARKALGGVAVPFASPLWTPGQPATQVPAVLGPLIGILYGIFVEVDDGGGAPKST